MNTSSYINKNIHKIYLEKFDKEVFDTFGVVIMRNILDKVIVNKWNECWEEFHEKKVKNNPNAYDPHNPVCIKEQLPDLLQNIYKDETLIKIAKQVWGDHLALCYHRILSKEPGENSSVILHQDFNYQLGFYNKSSFFIPLEYTNENNGGITFYPGTHQYGYLYPAGNINKDFFKEKWIGVTPELRPGDFVIMNSLLWHESPPNKSKKTRIIIDCNYQPANDPSSRELLAGEWQTDLFIDKEGEYTVNELRDKMFISSQLKTIASLTEICQQLEAENKNLKDSIQNQSKEKSLISFFRNLKKHNR